MGSYRIGLRYKLVFAMVALVVAPLLVVWSVGLIEDVIQWQIAWEVDRGATLLAARAVERELDPASPSSQAGWLGEGAEDQHLMVRVIDDQGQVTLRTDPRVAERWIHIRQWWMGLDDLFFGPPGPPDLMAHERSLAPEMSRPEVRAALDGRTAGRWTYDNEARMMVYSVAAPLPNGSGAIHVTRVSRRVIRSLYDVRYQLLKLTLFMAFAALLLGLWIGRRMVAPLARMQRLIDEYLRRPRPKSLDGLALERLDELGDLSRAFRELATRLERQSDERAGIAGDLAHDLKNPIATVAATAELLEGDVALDDDRRRRIASALDNAAGHMTRSVEGLIRLARLDATLTAGAHAPVDLTALLPHIVASYEDSPRQKNIELRLIDETDGLGLVDGVAEQLEQAVLDLVENALTFAESEVRLDLERNGNRVVLTVSDDGPGVSTGNRDKVFRRFFTSRPGNLPAGTGLGLAIVASVVLAHDGEVTLVDDGPLAGASFQVSLPALDETHRRDGKHRSP